jgi:hypothetical protein
VSRTGRATLVAVKDARVLAVPVKVRCAACGDPFELSARRARVYRDRPEAVICHDCRRKPREPSEAEREKLRRWWLDRLSPDEIAEIGTMLFPA